MCTYVQSLNKCKAKCKSIYYINKLAKKNYWINVTKHARFEVKWHLCWGFWSSGMLHCIVVTGLITTNPWRWRCYVPSKLRDMLKHLLHNVTEHQNLKQRMFITCCSTYKAELQSLYNHTRRSTQPLQKQSPLIHCSIILNKLVVTQPVKKLTNFMKTKHSSPFWVVLPCILVSNMKWFTNLMQLNIYLCSLSSTCFGLIRPSSGATDVTISLHVQHMVSLV